MYGIMGSIKLRLICFKLNKFNILERHESLIFSSTFTYSTFWNQKIFYDK